jgi:hypothetical protein
MVYKNSSAYRNLGVFNQSFVYFGRPEFELPVNAKYSAIDYLVSMGFLY